ncbi:P-loop containing nucleoside triphosphate hydrolase protein [Ephemerocybe angulata]|uniref:P-loop containing nucleoside triphosphate hydrolase protein n=1 Tax=Ephemerocybe angulata TaxID=980116 RepID=A0A8H6IEM6_9AGAR|nr:P-loop containing nucleoside triphosphate hydrolase protein [Tulosesus angulatus]
MRISPTACSAMRSRIPSRKALFPNDFHLPQRTPSSSKAQKPTPDSVYEAWLKSREMPNQKGVYLVPGAPRPLTVENAHLAWYVSQTCIYDLALIIDEILRRVVEGFIDSLLTTNENIVLGSARFFIEYKQMEHRVRLDVPTLADPQVRDLLQESDLFARSFSGGGFGFISPLDFINIFSLLIEILSHLWLILTLTRNASCFGEMRAAEKQERMRNLAYSDIHRPEISLFGLGDWILNSWSAARKIVLASEQTVSRNSTVHFADLMYALQNLPVILILQSTSTTLGAITAYRSSIHMKLKPKLQPRNEDVARYMSQPGGVSIDVKGLSYTYPGAPDPALRNITFSLQAGETLAIVGYNGSGKSTLAKILLRITDFDKGMLHINGVDVRRYTPQEYHRHTSAVFQGFSKFNSTVRENVGLGNVDKMRYKPAIETAVHLAEADMLVESLPNGLKTLLETPGFESISYPGAFGGYDSNASQRQGLSGGEWQRIALARAFMRANEPEVDLLVFDEPTSSLDAHAQNQIFETIGKISKTPSGDRRKTVIYITHRLSTARRADKVAMMDKGTITEFGSHEELMAKNGPYAALYRASI